MRGYDYPDVGDTVIVLSGAAEQAHARMAKPDLVGEHGVIIENDGWGLCTVEFPNGRKASLWNGLDLERVAAGQETET